MAALTCGIPLPLAMGKNLETSQQANRKHKGVTKRNAHPEFSKINRDAASAHANNFAYTTAAMPERIAPAQKGKAFKRFFFIASLSIKSNIKSNFDLRKRRILSCGFMGKKATQVF